MLKQKYFLICCSSSKAAATTADIAALSKQCPKNAGNVHEDNDPEVFVIVIDTCTKGEQKRTQLGTVEFTASRGSWRIKFLLLMCFLHRLNCTVAGLVFHIFYHYVVL